MQNDLEIHSRFEILNNNNISYLVAKKIMEKEELNKMKNSNINEVVNVMVNIGNITSMQQINTIMDHTRYINLDKLLRITAYVKRFISNLAVGSFNQRKAGSLETEEVREGELLWISTSYAATFI